MVQTSGCLFSNVGLNWEKKVKNFKQKYRTEHGQNRTQTYSKCVLATYIFKRHRWHPLLFTVNVSPNAQCCFYTSHPLWCTVQENKRQQTCTSQNERLCSHISSEEPPCPQLYWLVLLKAQKNRNERMLPLDFKWSEKKTKRFSLSNTSSKKGGWVEDETLSVLLGWRQAEAGWVLNSFHRHYSEQAVVLNVSCVTQCVLFTVCFV